MERTRWRKQKAEGTRIDKRERDRSWKRDRAEKAAHRIAIRVENWSEFFASKPHWWSRREWNWGGGNWRGVCFQMRPLISISHFSFFRCYYALSKSLCIQFFDFKIHRKFKISFPENLAMTLHLTYCVVRGLWIIHPEIRNIISEEKCLEEFSDTFLALSRNERNFGRKFYFLNK